MSRTRIAWILTFAAWLLPAISAGGDEVIPNDTWFKCQASFRNPGGTLLIPSYSYKPSDHAYPAVRSLDPGLTRAWAISTGRKSVVVAVLDDGFFYGHEDIRDNVWRNPGESGPDAHGFPKEANGLDDDGNGFVDDVLGWDFAFDDPDPDPYIFDGMDATRIQPYWHSIPTLGIIGARGNNGLGVAGVNWEVSKMLLKIGAQGVRGPDLERGGRAARAIRYAADNGARVINWSGFISDTRPETLAALRDAVDYAGRKGVLLVVGAGNSGLDVDRAENFTYPACFESDNILTVAEIDFRGDLYRYTIDGHTLGSNYGPKNVDLAAIGMNFSTFLRNNISVYALAGGTSGSTPVVSGVAALVLSVRSGLEALELKSILMNSARPLDSLKGKVGSGGMVDAEKALRLALERGDR
jgi:thermitase